MSGYQSGILFNGSGALLLKKSSISVVTTSPIFKLDGFDDGFGSAAMSPAGIGKQKENMRFFILAHALIIFPSEESFLYVGPIHGASTSHVDRSLCIPGRYPLPDV